MVVPNLADHPDTTSRDQQTDAISVYASDLQQIVRDLLFKTHVSPAQIQNLARRIQLNAETFSVAGLFANPGASMQCGPSTYEWRSEPVVYATGIRTACLLAYAAPRIFGWSDRTELLVIAALIQDAGILLLERQYDFSISQLAIEEPAAYRQHPALSAALAAAFIDYAVDLPAVIAQHHERCDGTGYPSGMRSDQLSAPSRFLSVAVRFVELTQGKMIGESTVGDRGVLESQFALASGQLWREAKQGEFDLPLTAAFLQQLGQDVPQEDRPKLGRHFQIIRFGEKQFRHDEAALERNDLPIADIGSQVSAVNGPHGDKQSTRRQKTVQERAAAQR